MRRPRLPRSPAALVPALVFALAASLGRPVEASSVSDFQARLAQTLWSAQQTEAILRTLPQSAAPVSTPEGLSSHLGLLAENTAALNGVATVRGATDEQRRAAAEALGVIATALHDQTALAGNRGLVGAVATLSELEEASRAAIAQLAAVKGSSKR